MDLSHATSHSISVFTPKSSAMGFIFFKRRSFWYAKASSAPFLLILCAIPLAIENLFAIPVIKIFLFLSIFNMSSWNYKLIT